MKLSGTETELVMAAWILVMIGAHVYMAMITIKAI